MNIARSLKAFGLVAVTGLFLAACGGGGGGGGGGIFPPAPPPGPPGPPPPPPAGGGNVSGTVASPQALANSYVIACHIPSGTQCQLGHAKTIGGKFPAGTGTTSPYTIQNVTSGNYYIIAWYDFNNNSSIDDGDAAECFGNGTACTVVTPPKTGVNISFGAGGASVQSLVGGRISLK